MAEINTTQGFIFKRIDTREADQIFSVFTKNSGKIEVLGKGIRKAESKLRSNIDIFSLRELEFIQGKAYKTLTDVHLLNGFSNIKKNFEKAKVAYKISETLDSLIIGQEKDEEVYNLLDETFNKLDKSKNLNSNVQLICYYFIWNLLSILGYKIDLYNCASCKEKLKPRDIYFNSQEGGLVDCDCSNENGRNGDIFPETVKILRIMLKKDWKLLPKIKFQESHLDNLRTVSENYLFCHRKSKFDILN